MTAPGRVFDDPAELAAAAGLPLGSSGFVDVDQERIDRFADVTGDRAWIHVDTRRARTGPFGGTVAHGFLALSLLTALLDEIFRVDGTDFVINRGLDKVRFMTPVRAGDRVRAEAVLTSATERPHGYTEAVVTVKLHVESEPVPALSAQQRLLFRRTEPFRDTEPFRRTET